MIKARYDYKNSPYRTAEFESSSSGLLLFDGLGAQELFNLLSLKGEDDLDGFCVVNEEDLLDINNANRDRLPVSVISISTYSFSIIHTQVPIGGKVDTTEVNDVSGAFLAKERLPEAWSLNFKHLFEAIYKELCAKPHYLLLHLGNADKEFARAVVGLCYKAFKDYPIFIYAHSLTEDVHEEITIFEDIEAVLHPEKPLSLYEAEQQEKGLVQTAFLNDLMGTGDFKFDPNDDWDDSFFEGGKAPQRARWQMILGIGLEVIAYLPLVAFFVMMKTDFILFFGSLLIYIVLTTASGYFGTRLYKEKRKKHFWKNKMLKIYCFSSLALLAIGFLAILISGVIGGFSRVLYAYIVDMSVVLLHAFIMFFYYWFEHKIFFREEKKKDGQ